ncbi:MAG: hypothetical protein NUV97_00320 [archaeon]|nr:hypothetical protein [archaeon]
MERETRITLPPSPIHRRGFARDIERLQELQTLRKETDIFKDRLPVRVETDYPYFFLLPLSDVHLGHVGVNYEALKTYVKTIQEYPFYTLTLGDMGDFFNPKILAHAMLGDVINPGAQMEAMQGFYGALGHKVLGIVDGNHERFAESAAGVEVYRWITEDAGIPLLNSGAVMDLKVNDVEYKGLLAHRFAKVNSMFNKTHGGLQQIRFHAEPLDFVISGDKHLGAATQTFQGGRPITVVQTGTFKTDDQWGKSVGFIEPPNIFFPVLAFDTRVKKPVLQITDLDQAVEFTEAIDDIWKKGRAKDKRKAVKNTGVQVK